MGTGGSKHRLRNRNKAVNGRRKEKEECRDATTDGVGYNNPKSNLQQEGAYNGGGGLNGVGFGPQESTPKHTCHLAEHGRSHLDMRQHDGLFYVETM